MLTTAWLCSFCPDRTMLSLLLSDEKRSYSHTAFNQLLLRGILLAAKQLEGKAPKVLQALLDQLSAALPAINWAALARQINYSGRTKTDRLCTSEIKQEPCQALLYPTV